MTNRIRVLASIVATGIALGWPVRSGAEPAQPAPPPPRAVDTCLVVDADSNLDDLRAIAVLTPHWHVAAVVATDGMLPATLGAPTLARFLAALEPAARPLLIQGRARDPIVASPNWHWLDAARRDAMRIEGALARVQPERGSPLAMDDATIDQAFARALSGCVRVGLVSLAPWTSFSGYYAHIKDRLAFVVGQGRSPDDPDDPQWDRVNCSFDAPACRAAMEALRGVPQSWVDLIYGGNEFLLDDAMVERLGRAPLARSLRTFMEADRQWEERHQQLWDDAPAAFLVCPRAFETVGRRYQPTRAPERMRSLVADLASGSDRCESP